MPHKSVLLNEMLQNLEPHKDGIYLDCTFGAGGYSKAILETNIQQLYACDQDLTTKKYFDALLEQYPNKINFLHNNFNEIDELLTEQKFDGIVLDLGVSSMQLDIAERGFSFNKNGPLDMRMNQQEGVQSAADFVNFASENDLADVIYYYGDEREAKKIARAIIKAREIEPIETTLKLASIVKTIIRPNFKQTIDPATKTFQAIRIYINDEMNNLITSLQRLSKILKVHGKMIVVSFHSTEDRIVKKIFQNIVKKERDNNYKLLDEDFYSNSKFETTKQIIMPGEQELKENIRSRSAKMRILTRIS